MKYPVRAATLAVISIALTAFTGSEARAQQKKINCVNARAGTICGTTDTATVLTTLRTIPAYKGIRYAEAPIGSTGRRWMPPAAILSYADTANAVAYGNVCLQKKPPAGQTMNEDCLFLNVWTPNTSPPTKMPVMVFIHGGAFVGGAGSSPLYNGTYLAASANQVVVTLNYRLGPLGFLYATSNGITVGGNLGLLDQQTALAWVRRNITAFGGDTARVTVFGESAGAMSVGLHLFSMPASDSLFQAAIMESNPMGYPYRTSQQALTSGGTFLTALCASSLDAAAKCDRSRRQHDAKWLQEVDSASIRTANEAYMLGLWGRIKNSGLPEGLPWAPTIDGTNVKVQPYTAYPGTMRRKPFVFGMNRDEGVVFASMAQSLLGYELNAARYDTLLSRVFGPVNRDTILNHQVADGTYPYRPQGHATAAPLDAVASALAQLLNDFAFNCANLAAADAAYTMNGSNPIFGYRFAQQPFFNLYADSKACLATNPYACHAYELPYVFRTFSYARKANGGTAQPTSADAAVSAAMSGAWSAFASNPTSTAGSLVQYVRTTPPTQNAPTLMGFGGSTPGMQGGLALAANCSMWNTMPPFQGRQ